jgi:hypothetical protein
VLSCSDTVHSRSNFERIAPKRAVDAGASARSLASPPGIPQAEARFLLDGAATWRSGEAALSWPPAGFAFPLRGFSPPWGFAPVSVCRSVATCCLPWGSSRFRGFSSCRQLVLRRWVPAASAPSWVTDFSVSPGSCGVSSPRCPCPSKRCSSTAAVPVRSAAPALARWFRRVPSLEPPVCCPPAVSARSPFEGLHLWSIRSVNSGGIDQHPCGRWWRNVLPVGAAANRCLPRWEPTPSTPLPARSFLQASGLFPEPAILPCGISTDPPVRFVRLAGRREIALSSASRFFRRSARLQGLAPPSSPWHPCTVSSTQMPVASLGFL